MEKPKHKNFCDLDGKIFGKLKVISFAGLDKNRRSKWNCECLCGVKKILPSARLVSGNCKSCGCLLKEFNNKTKKTHGMRKTSEWSIWQMMRQRCENKNSKKYPYYGGRGIKVCKRWSSFENFYADMGPRPSKKHSLDRINNDGNYEPSNCRWATSKQQINNTRVNRIIVIGGEKLTVQQASQKYNLPKSTLRNRLERGETYEVSILTKEQFKQLKKEITK